jgi:hypothetical protein
MVMQCWASGQSLVAAQRFSQEVNTPPRGPAMP